MKAVIFDMYETLITLYATPLYFSAQMAKDAGISEQAFQRRWRATEPERTTGKISFEEIIEMILRENDCFNEDTLNLIVKRRMDNRRESFRYMHPEILPMFQALKDRGIKIGLISNCFSEEAKVIKESVLFPYFDAVCLSYDEGIKKPDLRIFERCIEKLNLKPKECLYVGDGGSNELAAAQMAGMQSAQAIWYLKDDTMQPCGPMAEYINLETPMDVRDTDGCSGDGSSVTRSVPLSRGLSQ